MDKTFTFDNNIKSFERYKLNNSVITVLGEIHDSDNKSNIAEYINNINNTDDTIVFLELDTKSVNDKIYMQGINSSTIKDVVDKFRNDKIYYFDNRNEFLGGRYHFELYYNDIRQLDVKKYIDIYQKFITSNVRLENETRVNYEIRQTIISELERTNIEKTIIDENIAKFNIKLMEYNNIKIHYGTERDKLKNFYETERENLKNRYKSEEFEAFYTRDLENLNQQEQGWQTRINQQEQEWQTRIKSDIEEYREPLITSFREFWANVVDENLIQMIRKIIESKPEAKFEFIIIVGSQHTRNLNYRFIHNPSQWMIEMNLEHLRSDYIENNERIKVDYRADSFWDDPKMQLDPSVRP